MAKRITTEEQGIIKDMRLEGYGPTVIGNKLGRDKKTIQNQFKTLGLPTDLKEAGIELIKSQPVIKTIQCKRCGETYSSKRYNAKFCSDRCKSLYNKRNIAPKRMCAQCDKTFRSYKDLSFCSSYCKSKDSDRRRNIDRVILIRRSKCKHCNKITYSKRKRMYCSSYCSNKSNYKYISKARTHSIKCKECGKHKTVPFKRKFFCSTKCSNKYEDRIKESKRRRKILSNGNADWSISIERLMKRDKSICYLCGAKVDVNDFIVNEDGHHFSGDSYPSIEHFMPVSKGGTHTWDNVRLAHRKCNWEKGIEILEEELFIK